MIYTADHNYTDLAAGLAQEQIEIEWYEVRKTTIERKTSTGEIVVLNRKYSGYLNDGQVVYKDASRMIRLCIRPCTSIILRTRNIQLAGQFCFDVGNRHLPIFCLDDDALAVAYDGRLYSALSAKYAGSIVLEAAKLMPEQSLQMSKKSNKK